MTVFYSLSAAVVPAIWICVGTIIASLIVRGTKIAEFRQAWINDLRDDIAAFLTKANEQNQKLSQANGSPNDTAPVQEANPARQRDYEAEGIYRRIQLRVNPREPEHVNLLSSLRALIDLDSRNSKQPAASWMTEADTASAQASEVLKHEWTVTKSPLQNCVMKLVRFPGSVWKSLQGPHIIQSPSYSRWRPVYRIGLVILVTVSGLTCTWLSLRISNQIEPLTSGKVLDALGKLAVFGIQIWSCINLWSKDAKSLPLTRWDRLQPALALVLTAGFLIRYSFLISS